MALRRISALTGIEVQPVARSSPNVVGAGVVDGVMFGCVIRRGYRRTSDALLGSLRRWPAGGVDPILRIDPPTEPMAGRSISPDRRQRAARSVRGRHDKRLFRPSGGARTPGMRRPERTGNRLVRGHRTIDACAHTDDGRTVVEGWEGVGSGRSQGRHTEYTAEVRNGRPSIRRDRTLHGTGTHETPHSHDNVRSPGDRGRPRRRLLRRLDPGR